MSTPSIQDLSHFIGTWDCTETFHAGGWSPKEIVTTNARDVFSWGPGKKFIHADYESLSEFGLFQAHDVIFWDANARVFKFYFFDSFSGGAQVQDGRLDGKVLTFAHREEMNGKAGVFKRIYRFEDANHQTLEVLFEADDGSRVRIATIAKTRRP